MARPSKCIDQALLLAGRRLYPQTGCAALSLRALASAAGVNPSMFHYHFKTKENFLRRLLQDVYEELFAELRMEAEHDGAAMVRLRAALLVLTRFMRDHRRLMARIWTDVLASEPVAVEFLQRNAPRHLGLLAELLQQAAAEGSLRPLPPLQCMTFLLGALVMPVTLAAGIVERGVSSSPLRHAFDTQVMTDDALAQRADLALQALQVRPSRANTDQVDAPHPPIFGDTP